MDEVVAAIDDTRDYYDDDCEFDKDEPVMDGSDDEYGEFDEVAGEQIEHEMEVENEGIVDEVDETADLPNEWTQNLTQLHISPFSSSAGPTVDIPDDPLSVFNIFFTPEILQGITAETNRYARHALGEDYSRFRPVTVEELRAYFGFCILMSVNNLPAAGDYWRRDPIYHYVPIASRISRDRFREIGRYLHFVDNNTLAPHGDPSHDRLGKIRPLINHLSSRFQAVYSPHKNVAVDEAMIKFQGRSSLKQYMPLKPTKRGIKVWVLADSQNGYFWKFEVYTGKDGETVEKGLPARVVKRLTEQLKGKYHHVFFDNFFNSFELLNDLVEDDIYACGTARSNRRGFPEQLKKVKLDKRYNSAVLHFCVCCSLSLCILTCMPCMYA